MPWVRLEDDMPDHPKIAALSNGAFRTWVEALCYANRYLTDGQIPETAVPASRRRYIRQLLDTGLWSKNGDGTYAIHDYLEYQPSRAATTAAQRVRSDAARKAAVARWHPKRGQT